MKTISDCLNLFDCIMSSNIEKRIGIDSLENVRDYVIQTTDDKCFENNMIMLDILSEINLIIEKFYIDENSDINKECETLRKILLIWLDKLYKNIEYLLRSNNCM